jgi:hypothetical protein
MQPLGCRLAFRGNVLYCCEYCTFEENLAACKQALAIIDPAAFFPYEGGEDALTEFDALGGKIDRYSAQAKEA